MTAVLEPVAPAVLENRAVLDNLLNALQHAENLGDLHEARARAEAVKAWARVHGHVKDIRLDLLRLEVEALVRIVQLGGVDTLPAKDQKAALWLSEKTASERARLVAESGTATTATGLCRSIWADDELIARRKAMRRHGIEVATNPDGPITDDEINQARQRVSDVAAFLANVLDDYTEKGEPFSINEMTRRLIDDACLGSVADDPDLRHGISDVCREAVRRAPALSLDGTILPRTVTARTGEGDYVRIPVANARVAHLDDMRALRREQLDQDMCALRRLDELAERLREIPGCTDQSRIGDLVSQTIAQATA